MEKCAQYVSNSHHLLYFAALDNVDTCMIERVIRMLTRKERKKQEKKERNHGLV
jgi:hypothetical protein